MRWSLILRLSVFLVIALSVVLFTVQNLSRTTLLSFDVYFSAWQLSQPVPVPCVIWVSFATGALFSAVLTMARIRGLSRTVSRLEQDALLRSAGRQVARPGAATDAPSEPGKPASPGDGGAESKPGDDWGR